MELTKREQEIYELICRDNMTKRQLANSLGVSPHTINDYIKNIYRKCEVQSRADLIFNYWREREPRY